MTARAVAIAISLAACLAAAHPAAAQSDAAPALPNPATAQPDGIVPVFGLPAWGSEPVPQVGTGPSALTSVSALAADEVWSVGHTGNTPTAADATPLVERWDGSHWTVVPTPALPGAVLYGVSAVSDDDVWMVGTFNSTKEALVLHWDGIAIERVSNPNPGANRNDLYAVTSAGPNDVWAVGQKTSGVSDPLTLHWDGTGWEEVIAPGTPSYDQLNGITVVASDDIWAVGSGDNRALALHWDGATWTQEDVTGVGNFSRLNAVTGGSADELWAVGRDIDGTLTVRWDGSSWLPVDAPNPVEALLPELFGVTAIGPADVWAAGVRYVSGIPRTLVLHWDGQSWLKVSTPNPPASTHQLADVSSDPDGRIWGVGSIDQQAYALLRADTSWTVSDVQQVGMDANRLLAISAAAPDDIWTVGSVGDETPLALHFDGTTWANAAVPAPPEGAILNDVVAIGPADAWAVGQTSPGELKTDSLAMHWDGTTWSSVPVPQPGGVLLDELLAVDAVSPDDVWAVGGYDVVNPRTTIVHWDGDVWTEADTSGCSPYGGLSGVTMLSATDGWAVGEASTCRWDGSRWTLVASQQPRPLYFEINYPLQDVSAAKPDDVWAVGTVVYDFGTYVDFGAFAEHWNGSVWERVPNPPGVTINGVEALSRNYVWAVGHDGSGPMITRWDGSSWVDVPTPDREDGGSLQGVTVATGKLWAAGETFGPDDTLQSLVQRAPSPTDGAVLGTTNAGNATVIWTGPESGSVVTDPTGAFQLAGLVAGTYQLTVSHPLCELAIVPLTIVAGRTQPKNIVLDCS